MAVWVASPTLEGEKSRRVSGFVHGGYDGKGFKRAAVRPNDFSQASAYAQLEDFTQNEDSVRLLQLDEAWSARDEHEQAPDDSGSISNATS